MSLGSLILLGLGMVLIVGQDGTTSRSTQQRLPAPQDPKPLPKRRPCRLPARRVHEWRCDVVDEHGLIHTATAYAPTDAPATAPWWVTAWYDAKRNAEVIRVEFNASTTGDAELSFAVRRGNTHDANRMAFRQGATQLWPDDKWNDRVVHRYVSAEEIGCFLIEVRIDDETIDFFHESQRETPPLAIEVSATDVPAPAVQSPLDAEFRAYWGALAEIEAKREELATAEVPEPVRKGLEKFLDQKQRGVSAKYLGGTRTHDYLAPRR